MPLIHFLQRLADLVPPRDAMAVVVLLTALAAALSARIRTPAESGRHRWALGAVALGAILLLIAPHGVLPAPLLAVLTLAVITGFALATVADRRLHGDQPEEPLGNWRTSAIWIGAAAIAASLFLFADLGGYSGSLMVWEPEAMKGLVEASTIGTPVPRFIASRLLWGQGLVSSGHDSLLFGGGTYLVWKVFGVSPATLRVMSALFALACLPIIWVIGKRLGGTQVATAAVVVMALNPMLVFYGRYGTSLAATFLAVLAFILVSERLLDPTPVPWWLGLAVAAAAILATLGYAMGRVVTVAVVVVVVLSCAMSWRRLPGARRVALLLLVSALIGFWLAQASFKATAHFVDVRGEQVLAADPQPNWVDRFVKDREDREDLASRHRLVAVGHIAGKRLLDFKKVLSYSLSRSNPTWYVMRGDPPHLPLAQGAVLLFALWGFGHAVANPRHRMQLLLPVVLVSATVPLLLTNRVDVHRLSLVIVPMVPWAAMGIVAAHRVLRACTVPRAAQIFVAAILMTLVVADNSTFLFYPRQTRLSPLVTAVHDEIDAIRGPIAVGTATTFVLAAEIRMAVIDRQRVHPDSRWHILSDDTVRGLTGEPRPDSKAVDHVRGMLHHATVILAPREPFKDAVLDLEARGARVRPVGEVGAGMWRLDLLAEGEYRPRDADNLSPQVIDQSKGLRLPVTDAQVVEVFHDFKPPRFDASWTGEPIIMGGATYGFGIGMHAWTSMHFEVPDGAVAFEALIGLSDAVLDCDRALVRFEVLDGDGGTIFESRPMGVTDAPQRIRVPIDGVKGMSLVVSDANNGRDCDHANWAQPFFLFDR